MRLPGVLLGQELARACADMDVFQFPSRTDTYGNVVWEASASGAPAVVTDSGGPRHIVQDRVTGIVSRSDEEFVRSALRLYRDPALRTSLGAMARRIRPTVQWSLPDRGRRLAPSRHLSQPMASQTALPTSPVDAGAPAGFKSAVTRPLSSTRPIADSMELASSVRPKL